MKKGDRSGINTISISKSRIRCNIFNYVKQFVKCSFLIEILIKYFKYFFRV